MTAILGNEPGPAGGTLLLDAALESIPFGFCVWSSDFRLVMWNQHYLDIYGFPSRRIYRGMALAEVVTLSAELGNHPDQTPEDFLEEYQRELLGNRSGLRAKVRELVEGGRTIETGHVYSPGLGWVITHEDVTEEIASSELAQRRKRDLERQNLRLSAVVNNISQGLCMFDAKGHIVVSNAPYARIYGLPASLAQPGATLDDILDHLFSRGMIVEGDTGSYRVWRRRSIAQGEFVKSIYHLDGRVMLMQQHPMKDGGWVSTHEDITEQRQQEARIRHLARHDALTELPNRSHFLEAMAECEADIARGRRAAVLCIDLDHFKDINDSFGHSLGDKVLQQAAARLTGSIRENDLLARLGGDEFSVLLRSVDRPADAAHIAERIIEAMTQPFVIDGHHVSIGASVGIAVAPADGSKSEQLMKNADLALYRAKAEGRATFRFFERGMDEAMQQRRSLETGLRLALPRQEFRLMYQPLVDLKQDRVTCLEALLRWQSPERGNVPPTEFIPIAEETGLIVPIGDWVLREALHAAASWPDETRVAVNLSTVQFKNNRLYETVVATLAESGLSPTRLELEITESLLLAESEPTLACLHKLRALGVRISMDDFGTGYSSLSYLRSFPFDKIKIDRSFMRDLGHAGGNLAIVRAVIGLGHSLGMTTTAEGIETEEQLAAVREQGCNEVQGFLFSRPIEADAVIPLLQRQGRPQLRRVV